MKHSDSFARLNELLPLVYDQLRAYASRVLTDEPSQLTLQTTELVHEVYLRLSTVREVNWTSDQEIKQAAIGVMRRVLVDCARSRRSMKRTAPGWKLAIGAHVEDVHDRQATHSPDWIIDLLVLEDALHKFQAVDPRKAEVVQMRYFGGLQMEEIAELLDVSLGTVKRDWVLAKAWLYRELQGAGSVVP